MKFYMIDYDDGSFTFGNFADYNEALIYAKKYSNGKEFIVGEYESEEDYFNKL